MSGVPIPNCMLDAFLTLATLIPSPYIIYHVTGMKRKPKKWSNTSFRAVHPCIPTWYPFGWRRKHLTAFLTRSVQWGHLPYGRAPSTGWIWWLHSQWNVKPWVADPVTYKSGWGYAKALDPSQWPFWQPERPWIRVCFQSTRFPVHSSTQ